MASAPSPSSSPVRCDSRSQPLRQDSESFVRDELEVLRNVYLDEMRVEPGPRSGVTQLTFHLTPSTADDKHQQYVYLDLRLTLPPSYPKTPPTLALLQSRGLADAHLTSIQEGVIGMCAGLVGTPMVYELVEWVRESLTNHNRPSGQCSLCLCDFTDEDTDFRKTDCYHYFHTACLLRYVTYHQRVSSEEGEGEEGEGVLVCPVCREAIPDGSVCVRGSLLGEERIEEEEFAFVPSPALRRWQSKMARLLRRQRERGGVIDLTNRDTVIDETWVSTLSGGERTHELMPPISKPPYSHSGSNSHFKSKSRIRDSGRSNGRGCAETEKLCEGAESVGVARSEVPVVRKPAGEKRGRGRRRGNNGRSRWRGGGSGEGGGREGT